jgi:predicted RNase H-like HicB family nuclease
MNETMEDETMRQVIIYPGEDGWWVAECPSLPGCLSQGKSKDEAITNIREAIRGYVAALEEDRIPIPEEHFDAMLLAV